MKNVVLVVDEERATIEKIRGVIEFLGFETDFAETGEEAVEKIVRNKYRLILLDIDLPGITGFEVIKYVRKIGNDTPIIVISERSGDDDVLYALDIGADLYLTKPINSVTLGGRMKALLRRNQLSSIEKEIRQGPFVYNTTTLRLFKNDKAISLTNKENAIMKLFLDNVNHIFSKEKLYEMVWGNTYVDDNTIMVYISRLRQKIEDDPASPRFIENVRGIGYRFVV